MGAPCCFAQASNLLAWWSRLDDQIGEVNMSNTARFCRVVLAVKMADAFTIDHMQGKELFSDGLEAAFDPLLEMRRC